MALACPTAGITLLGALLVAPASLRAQETTGSLSGRITSADGARPLAGVRVTGVHQATNLVRSTVSGAEGEWRLVAMPLGAYRITFSAEGDSYQVRRSVFLGQDAFVRFRWPSRAEALVIVSAAPASAEMVDPNSAEIGVNVDRAVLADLPIMDRNVNSAAVLAPGVQIIGGGAVDPTKSLSTYIVAGEGMGRGTNFTVDGADNNSTDVGGQVAQVPYDAIDQFQILTGQFKAEFGRSNAGFLNVATRSGGNTFEGVLHAQYTKDGMRARYADESPRTSDSTDDLSLTVSGPAVKDRLFYMVSAERQRTAQSTLAFDPRVQEVYPTAAGLRNWIVRDNLYTRLDWHPAPSWLLTLSFHRFHDASVNRDFSGNPYSSPSFLGTIRDGTTRAGAKLTGTSGGLTWESTFSWFDFQDTIRPSMPGPNLGVDTTVRNTFVANTYDLWASGMNVLTYQNTGVKRIQWKNEATWVQGAHAAKGGFDIQKTWYPEMVYFFPEPAMTNWRVANVAFGQEFGPSVQPDANVLSFLLSAPIISVPFHFNLYGAYLQDDWNPGPRVSIHVGIRVDWDNQLHYMGQFDGLYRQVHALNPALAGMGDRAPRDRAYASPRLQFLWRPRGGEDLVVKAGFGRFVAQTTDTVVGMGRYLLASTNGLGSVRWYNKAAYMAQGRSTANLPQAYVVPSFAASPDHPFTVTVNGTPVDLTVPLTPFNYVNDVGGLRTRFQAATSALLAPASISTFGNSYLASDFSYPTTDLWSLGCALRFSERASLEATLLYQRTLHNTAILNNDGSGPDVTNLGPGGTDMGGTIFFSNQTATSRQVQVKFAYASPKTTFLATLVAKRNTSSSGGDGTAFGGSGNVDYYGDGALRPWLTGPERLSQGSESFCGSFAWTRRWETGTKASLLGTWHSGKFYDQWLGYNRTLGPGEPVSATWPGEPLGTGRGAWNLDLGLRLAQVIRWGRATFEPFLQVHNLLNNYDPGANYDGLAYLSGSTDPNPDYGKRFRGAQINLPRFLAVGFRAAW